MPNERIHMRKIREVLRLHSDCQLPGRAIARSLALSPNTVSRYLSKIRVANLSWPLPDGMDDDTLERLLFPPQADLPPPETRPKPDWAYIHKELRRKGVTLQLLWEEHRAQNPDGYQYSQFCELYRHWTKRIDPRMRQHHKAGEKLFVDFAGQTVPITEPATGEIRQAQIFVAVLGASNYTYAEACWSQDVPTWVALHVHAFEFFGGVPEIVVPDNLKSGVTRPNRYEPDINATFQNLARHYGTAIIPARVRKPRDKAKVEGGVLIVERWILAALRNQTFFTLPDLNAAIRTLLQRLNTRPFKKLDGNRESAFLALDKPALRTLPDARYEVDEWSRARVNIDYHIAIDRHYYSVPYTLVRQEVEIRTTQTTIEILHRGTRIASHPRSFKPGHHSTLPEHMPPNHLRFLEWTPERLVAWAQKKGPHAAQLVQAIMDSRDHPQQGFRAGLGILRLEKTYGTERLEAACRRALRFQAYSYKNVEAILKNGLDARPLPSTAENQDPPLQHDNVRGAGYYTEGETLC